MSSDKGFKIWNKISLLDDVNDDASAHNITIKICQGLIKQSHTFHSIFDRQSDSFKIEHKI